MPDAKVTDAKTTGPKTTGAGSAPFEIRDYLRLDLMPHFLCPGCGHGMALRALLWAVHELEISKDRLAIVSGIGCSGRFGAYIDANTFHTTHGRPLAFATGLALARPDLEVIVITGDGDCLAIGGNHLIHACRRNLNMTCLMLNNEVYGMTGGQVSPTTSENRYTTTTPLGNTEPAFDACKLAEAAGAGLVGRSNQGRSSQSTMTDFPDFKRLTFTPVRDRPQFTWPGGKRLARYIALNLEHFIYGEGGVDLDRNSPPPNLRSYLWRECGNRVGVWRILDLFDEMEMPMGVIVNTAVYDPAPRPAPRLGASRRRPSVQDLRTGATGFWLWWRVSFLETYSAARAEPRPTSQATVPAVGPGGKIATVASPDMPSAFAPTFAEASADKKASAALKSSFSVARRGRPR